MDEEDETEEEEEEEVEEEEEEEEVGQAVSIGEQKIGSTVFNTESFSRFLSMQS